MLEVTTVILIIAIAVLYLKSGVDLIFESETEDSSESGHIIRKILQYTIYLPLYLLIWAISGIAYFIFKDKILLLDFSHDNLCELEGDLNNKHIFIINGLSRSGKDTFVEFMKTHAIIYNYSTIETFKEIAESLGYEGEKTQDYRTFLHDMKMLADKFMDYSYTEASNEIEVFLETPESDCNILFIHIREVDSIRRLVEKYPQIKTILVTGNARGENSNEVESLKDEIFKYNYDYHICNDGTEDDLKKKAKEFYNSIK